MAELDLNAYSDVPIFNTKAVVQETGVPAATLRAWERRYGFPEPDRTATNYRLYSERDMALIRWLRERVESGLTISQAIELFRRMEQGDGAPTLIPGDSRRAVAWPEQLDWTSLQERLLDALLAFDERQADLVLSEAFAVHAIEEVAMRLIQPVLVEIGERWHRGEVTVPAEHFASNYLERKVATLFNAQPLNVDAPLVLAGCAPRELHQIGVLLLALFLRRLGLRVLYLGPNVPLVDLQAALQALHPAMLTLSAATLETAGQLVPIGEMVAAMPEPRPLFAFGGQAFERFPGIAERIPGLYLPGDALDAAQRVLGLIRRHVMRA